MQYYIKSLKRTIEIDDNLYNTYQTSGHINEQPITIVVRSQYGPNVENIPDNELSTLCNKIIQSEINAINQIKNNSSYYRTISGIYNTKPF